MARGKMSGNSITALLVELGAEVNESAKKALLDGANIILADAKSKIPNTTKLSIGKLSESGHLVVNKKGNMIRIVFDAKNDDYMYGKIVEFRPGHEHPFLYTAYDSHRNEVKENVIDAIRNAVRSHAVS